MAVSVNITVKGRQAVKELEGVERQTDRNAEADKRAAREASNNAKLQEQASQKAAAAAKRAADAAAAAKINAEKKAAAETAKQANKSTAAKMAAEKKAAADAARMAAKTAATKQREARRAAQAAERAVQEEMRSADKLARHWQQVAQRSAAHRMRTEDSTINKRRRDAERTLRNVGGIAGGVIAGTAVAAGSAMSTARNVAGVRDAATRVQQGNEFKQRLIITTQQAQMGGQADEIQGKIIETARATGTDPMEIMEGLSRAHEEFNALPLFVEQMDLIAKSAKATGSDITDFVGMMGNMRRAFQLQDKDFAPALNTLAAGASTGSVGMANFARDFPAAAGIFATNTGLRGMEGVRQFGALAQTVATGGFGSAESATRVERFSADLNDVKTRAGLNALDGVTKLKDGAPIDVGRLVEQLAKSKQFRSASVRQDIFKETRALQAVESLVAAKRAKDSGLAGAIDFTQQKNVSAALGAEDLTRTFAALESSGLIDMQRQAVEMQSDTIEHLGKYNEQILAVTKASNELEKAFGTLGLWASSIGLGAAATTGIGLASKFLGGGAGGAAAGIAGAGGGAGLLATLGTGAGTVGAGALAAGGLVAGGAGVGAGMLIDRAPKLFGSEEKFSDMLGGWLAKVAPWEDPETAKGFEREPAKIDVQVDLHDKRTAVTVKQREGGARVTTAAGPAVPLANP